jgi:hypothetical protein
MFMGMRMRLMGMRMRMLMGMRMRMLMGMRIVVMMLAEMATHLMKMQIVIDKTMAEGLCKEEE